MSAYDRILRAARPHSNGQSSTIAMDGILDGANHHGLEDSSDERHFDPESGLFVSGGGDAKPDETWPEPTAAVKKIGGSLQKLPDPWDPGWITMAELEEADIASEYHVEGIIPANEPMIIGAPAKGMKTTTSGDLLMCASSGETFGDPGDGQLTFAVPKPVRCSFVSCESGYAAIKKTFSAIAASRGRRLAEYDNLFLRAEKYNLCDPKTHVQFARLVVRQKIRVLVFDPTFLMMSGLGDDASNIFKQGDALEPISRICRDYGVTINLLHHFSNGAILRGVGKKPELNWLSYAGFDAWARAWLLLARREPYSAATPGMHKLTAIVGGSAGHSHDLAIDLDEGFRFKGRTTPPVYGMTIRDSATLELEAREIDETEKLNKAQQRREQIAIRNAGKLLAMLEKSEGPVTMTAARSGTGVKLDSDDVRTAMARLVASGEVVETTITATNKKQVQAWEIKRNA